MKINSFVRKTPYSTEEFSLMVNGKLVGKIDFSRTQNEFDIDWVEVFNQYQGNGYGSLLVEKFNELIDKEKGTGSLVDSVSSDSPAQGFYERHGWRKDGIKMYYGGENEA